MPPNRLAGRLWACLGDEFTLRFRHHLDSLRCLQRFAHRSPSYSTPDAFNSAFSLTLTTEDFVLSRLRWFGIPSCKAIPRDVPSSSLQLRLSPNLNLVAQDPLELDSSESINSYACWVLFRGTARCQQEVCIVGTVHKSSGHCARIFGTARSDGAKPSVLIKF